MALGVKGTDSAGILSSVKVLIVIPTRGDRPEMLAEAEESVYGQTVGASELIVASGTDSVADRINTAIASSDCDAFALLCDDDKLDPMFIEKCSRRMEETGADIVYTNCHIFGRRNCEGGALGEWTEENINRNTVPLVTSLCKKSMWARVGGYVLTPYFDWDFWWRCFYAGASASWLKEPLWWYREHAGQCSATENATESLRIAFNRFSELREAARV